MRRPGSGIWAICGGGNDGASIFQFSVSESAAITLAEKPFISHVRRLDHVPSGRVLSLRCRSRSRLGCPVPINKHSVASGLAAVGAELLDDLIHPPEHRRRDRQPECFGGLEIDHPGLCPR
jgi:hypothetical protein